MKTIEDIPKVEDIKAVSREEYVENTLIPEAIQLFTEQLDEALKTGRAIVQLDRATLAPEAIQFLIDNLPKRGYKVKPMTTTVRVSGWVA